MVVYPAPRQAEAGRGMDLRLAESRLAEAVGLAEAIDLTIVGSEAVPLGKPRPSTLLGQGTVERLGQVIDEKGAGLVVVDGHLSPVQQRNLERAWNSKVIDRTGLILEIFGARARTREGRLQVELASLSYQRSRLVRSWTHLERQRGGFGFLGGPGETQIEADRRLIGDRIVRLKKDLILVKRTRELHRQARRRVPYPIIALVGYTNAGKSTLFNTLTRAEVLAKDQLFATLDPTMRALSLPSGRTVILSDTVGFVSDLPHELVAAFRATLEEVLEADVIVHVRDVAHPDSEAQRSDVEAVLRELGTADAVDRGLIEALNKIDLLDQARFEALANQAERSPRAVPLSAVTGAGLPDLLALLDKTLSAERRVLSLDIPLTDGAALAWLYRHGEVLHREDDETAAHVTVRLDPADAGRFEKRV
ncbi:GTPase HflX [Telmatospirillum siberiense]|uniref:GTPase HflX n=1 Tax=Telmatospirillum siberiense TaxID=382514 RepID=A0A2N3PYW1_9PROT|nr:GTPase HflX [Telmatospirillum siberiense]